MKIRFCVECAAPLTKRDVTVYTCANGHSYFNNPHAGCSVVFLNDKHEALFSKRANDPRKGKFDFPGGFLEFGEDAYQAAQREIQEELGVTIRASDLQLIDSELNHYIENDDVCDFVFTCRKWRGTMEAHDDVAAYEWKPIVFLRSPDFAWQYKHLYSKLEQLIGTSDVHAN